MAGPSEGLGGRGFKDGELEPAEEGQGEIAKLDEHLASLSLPQGLQELIDKLPAMVREALNPEERVPPEA